MEIKNETIIILGASRGLGAALAVELRNQNEVIEISRKSPISMDFSKSDEWASQIERIRAFSPSRIIYCAAGGPYGNFGRFEWKDHHWALKVSFEFPAALIHAFLRTPAVNLRQLIVVGSSVAESNPDPGAASYAAAKHALRGLITSIQTETLPFDLRLLSPGYMKTDLLPLDSAPRKAGLAADPKIIAQDMIQSISDPALRFQNQSFD